MHFEIYAVQTPTNALFINLVKSFKFTLKYTIISLLHILVSNDHHQGTLSVPNLSYYRLIRPYGSTRCAESSKRASVCTAHNTHLCLSQSHPALHTIHISVSLSLTLHCTQQTSLSLSVSLCTAHNTISVSLSLTLHCTQHTSLSLSVSPCTAQNTHAALRHAATSRNLYNDVILPIVLT